MNHHMQHICLAILLLLTFNTKAESISIPSGIIETRPLPAPDFTLADMDGNKQSLMQYRGQWVFVHFWASWCGPCRREMPEIQKLYSLMAAQNLAFIIINTAESPDTVFAFLGGVAPELNSLLDHDGLVTEQWRPRGLPATYLVDTEGIIRYQALGGRPWSKPQYLHFLKQLLSMKSQ